MQLTFLDFEQAAACWNLYFAPYFLDLKFWKKRIGEHKSINQILFPGKSTTSNPMVKSDSVTSDVGTVPNLIF